VASSSPAGATKTRTAATLWSSLQHCALWTLSAQQRRSLTRVRTPRVLCCGSAALPDGCCMDACAGPAQSAQLVACMPVGMAVSELASKLTAVLHFFCSFAIFV
jgi:hypothetical protein